MSTPVPIVTSASDIAAILDTVGPDADVPLADTPIWNSLASRFKAMQEKFRAMDAELAKTVAAIQGVAEKVDEPDTQATPPKPGPRKKPQAPRRSPVKGSSGSSTSRAANPSQKPAEKVSAGNSGADSEETS